MRWLIYDIIKSSEEKIEELSSSEEAGKEEIDFFIQEKARKKFKRLINRIIDESVEERIDELRLFRKAEKKDKIRFHIQKEVKNGLKQLISHIIKEYLDKLMKNIIELMEKKEKSGALEETRKGDKLYFYIQKEVRNGLNNLVEETIKEYIEKEKIRFYGLEKTRKKWKQSVDNMIDKHVRNIDKIDSFERIETKKKIRLYILETIREVSKRSIDIGVSILELFKQPIDNIVDIHALREQLGDIHALREQLKDIIDSCLELRIEELSSFKEVEEEDKFLALREARKELKEGANRIINDCVKERVNEIIPEKVTEEGIIKIIYTYPLIVVKSGAEEYEQVLFSEETTSLCFEVVEPCWWPPSGRKHLMRISIPSTILYAEKKVGRSLLRDIINAIYQHCLYEKKGKDIKKLENEKRALEEKLENEKRALEEKLEGWEKIIEKKKIEKELENEKKKIEKELENEKKALEEKIFENRLDEDILVKLWTHILDTMGGESVEVRIARITNTTRLLAFLAFLVAFLTLIHRIFF